MMLRGRSGRRFACAAAAVVAALILFSCSGEGDSGDTAAESAPAGSEQPAVEYRHKGSVTNVTFRALDGSEKKVSDYGRMILVVNYIATWNEDSKSLIPVMNEVQRKFHANVVVLGILTDVKSTGQAQAFRNTSGVKFELLLPGGDPGRFGKASKLPTSHIVTREDYLLSSFEGLHRAKQYEDYILAMYRRRM